MEGYDKLIEMTRKEVDAQTNKGKLIKFMIDYQLMSPYKSPAKILEERIAKLKTKKDPASQKLLAEMLKVQEQFLSDKAAIEAELGVEKEAEAGKTPEVAPTTNK